MRATHRNPVAAAALPTLLALASCAGPAREASPKPASAPSAASATPPVGTHLARVVVWDEGGKPGPAGRPTFVKTDATARLRVEASKALLDVVVTVDDAALGVDEPGPSQAVWRARFEGTGRTVPGAYELRLRRTGLLRTSKTTPAAVAVDAPPREVVMTCAARRVDAHEADATDDESVSASTPIARGLPALACTSSTPWIDAAPFPSWVAGDAPGGFVFGEEPGFDWRAGRLHGASTSTLRRGMGTGLQRLVREGLGRWP